MTSWSSLVVHALKTPVPVGRRAETSITIIEYEVMTTKRSAQRPLGVLPVMDIVAPVELKVTVAVFDAKQPVFDHVAVDCTNE